MDDEDIEHTLYLNRDVKVYRIPPRPAAGGHSSGTWRVDDCIFTGRLRVMAKGAAAEIRLEDGSTGELFALCPFTPATQAVVIEATVDSSRYYVLRVEDPSTRRHAFLGIGFSDRGAAFDFNAALADHAKQCQRESIVAAHATAASSGSGNAPTTAAAAAGPGGSSWQDPAFAALYKDPGDLSLKEGQTIRIDVKRPPSRGSGVGFLTRSSDGSSGSGSGRHSSGGGSTPVLLPPPVLSPPPGQPQQLSSSQTHHAGPTAAAALAPATATAAAGRMAVAAPAAGTVASTEENWATFD